MIRVRRLGRVGLHVRDLGELTTFYSEIMGLTVAHETTDEARFFTLDRPVPCLAFFPTGQQGLHHLAFELGSVAEVEQALKELKAHRVQIVAEAVDMPGVEQAIRFTDPDGTLIELYAPWADLAWRTAGTGRLRPVCLQHVTLTSPDVERITTFYVDILGFKVSDWQVAKTGSAERVFSWLRCNPDHHTIAFVKGDQAAIDHCAYELSEWNDFKIWGDFLARHGIRLDWGPGRHGPGNNLFIMFKDPEGNRIEYSAELEQFWDENAHYEPRIWEPKVTTVNLWGPGPTWR